MDFSLQKSEKYALAGTILFHLLLIFLFLLFGLTYLEPPPPEEGILINFGYDNEGQGEEQSQTSVKSNQQVVDEEVLKESVNSRSVEEKVLTQQTEEAPKVNTENTQSIRKEEVVKDDPKPSKELSEALTKWKTKSSNQSASDGITGKQGDQGDPSGSLESNSYVGGSGGFGYSFNLSGRKMIGRPQINDRSQEEGKVVVEIIVDRNGNVVRATPGARGSTTTSSVLYNIAKEAAMSSKFNSSPNTPEQQKGQIVFTFIVKG